MTCKGSGVSNNSLLRTRLLGSTRRKRLQVLGESGQSRALTFRLFSSATQGLGNNDKPRRRSCTCGEGVSRQIEICRAPRSWVAGPAHSSGAEAGRISRSSVPAGEMGSCLALTFNSPHPPTTSRHVKDSRPCACKKRASARSRALRHTAGLTCAAARAYLLVRWDWCRALTCSRSCASRAWECRVPAKRGRQHG